MGRRPKDTLEVSAKVSFGNRSNWTIKILKPPKPPLPTPATLFGSTTPQRRASCAVPSGPSKTRHAA